jgi:predicted DNA-binding transcriptional regulator AlpA
MEQQKQLVTLTEVEVAEIFKCSRAALRRMRREKRGPRFIHVGRLVRYPLADVEAFIGETCEASNGVHAVENVEI